MRFLPSPRPLTRRVVEIYDDLPDLLLGQSILPGRHDRVPGGRLLRKPGPALRDAPEEVRLLQHGDRSRVLEVRRRRVEAVREVALSVEVVAVAVHAVANVDLLAAGLDGCRRSGVDSA